MLVHTVPLYIQIYIATSINSQLRFYTTNPIAVKQTTPLYLSEALSQHNYNTLGWQSVHETQSKHANKIRI